MADLDDNLQTNMNDANSDQSSGDKADVAATIQMYKERLMEDLGFGKNSGISDVEREQVEKKMEELVNARILNVIMLYLPEGKVAEFSEIAQKADAAEINDFVKANIPGYEDKILKELMDIKDELLRKAPVKDGK
ncbi:MAG: hypothetical protein WC080_03870 [Patescibacteria group bacterium]|jgi:hypothetical protein